MRRLLQDYLLLRLLQLLVLLLLLVLDVQYMLPRLCHQLLLLCKTPPGMGRQLSGLLLLCLLRCGSAFLTRKAVYTCTPELQSMALHCLGTLSAVE